MTIKRVLPLMLALFLLMLPLAHAEGTYGQITLSNFQVGYGAVESVPVDALLKLGAGVSEGEGLLRADAELLGGGKRAFSISMDAAEEAVRIKIGSKKMYLSLPYSMLETYAQTLGQNREAIKDPESLIASATYYADMITGFSGDAYMNIVDVALKSLHSAPKGEEPVELFGETQRLKRFDVQLDGVDFGRFLQSLAESDGTLETPLLQYVQEVAESVGLKQPQNAGEIAASIAEIDETHFDIQMDASFWADTDSLDGERPERLRGTGTLSVTDSDTINNRRLSSLSLDLSMLDVDGRQHLTVAVSTPKVLSTTLDFLLDSTYEAFSIGGAMDSLTLTMKYENAKTRDDTDFSARLGNITDAAGVTDSYLSYNGELGGLEAQFGFLYDGKTNAADRVEGAFELNASLGETKASLECDTLLELIPLIPLTDADFEGMTAVNPEDGSQEELALMKREVLAMGSVLQGVVLTTPGMSKLIAGWDKG